MNPGLAVEKLHEQAECVGLGFKELVERLGRAVPAFANHLRCELYLRATASWANASTSGAEVS